MTTAAASAPPTSGRALPTLRALRLPPPELGALLLLAAVLNLWALDVNGWANEYYSAAVRSMSESWNAFLFGTFDASGVMTVDKPPMALWVQGLCLEQKGRVAEAESTFGLALIHQPHAPWVEPSLGHLFARTDRTEKAEDILVELRSQLGCTGRYDYRRRSSCRETSATGWPRGG